MAKFTLSAIALLAASLSGLASAAPLEARWFPTCDIKAQGLRSSATELAQSLSGLTSVSLDVTAISPNVGLVASTTDATTGITTYIGAFSLSGEQVTTYAEAGQVAAAILSNCAFLGDHVAGSMASSTNANLVFEVYGTYN
ncbi:hypothetical protein GQ53DRAFT_742312 [Thozetella sp. PMI_491]|nr:hypothetical protein GQ53DRAFT_742312 [Thozetella sp. PMI_491]